MATKNLFLHSPSAGDIDEIYKEGAESISRLSLPSFPGVHSRNTRSAPSTGSGFESAVSRVLAHEGGFTASDGNTGAPANFGINQKHNPDVDVRNITQDDAKEIYRNRYWNAIGGDDLPAELQATALDAAVNQGPANARKWIEQSGGDVQKFNALRRQHYEALAAKPEYARFRNTWLRRLASYEQEAQGAGDPAALQAELDREEPGRYRVLSEDEVRRLSLQQELDAQEPGRYKVLSPEELAAMPEFADADPARAPDASEIEGETGDGDKVGAWDTTKMIAGQLWDAAVYHLPASVAAAVEGDDPFAERDWKDALIERSRERMQERASGVEKEAGTAIPGVTTKDVQGLGPSLGFSATGMGAGIAAGLPASAAGTLVAPGVGTAAGFAAGGAASGAAAYRMATNQFVRDLRDAADIEAMKERGRKLTDEEFAERMEPIKDSVREYGLWEAVPEAASNVIGFGILKAGVKDAIGRVFGKNILTRLATKSASVYGTELATETITEHGQHNVQADLGMEDQRRSWTSAADLGESFREVAPLTIMQTTILAGGTKGAMMLQDHIKRAGLTREQYDALMELNDLVERGQFDPEQARLEAIRLLDPNGAAMVEAPGGATPQQPAAPTATPQAQPAPTTAPQPSGPITRALDRAGVAPSAQATSRLPEEEAQAPTRPRVRITAENGESMTGFAESLSEDGTARIVGDDGQTYVIGPDDGVTIEPIVDEAPAAAPEVAAPVTETGIPVFPQDQALTEPEPVAPPPVEVAEVAAPEDRPLTEYSDAELRDQLRAITQQAKLQGMSDELRALRRTISEEIDRRNQERDNARRTAADPIPVPDDRVAGGQLPAQDRADQPAGTQDAQAIPGGSPAGRAEANAAPVGEGVFDAGTAADTQPALITRTDGTPFKSEATALQAMKNRRLKGYRPVQVEGGWALEEAPAETPEQYDERIGAEEQAIALRQRERNGEIASAKGTPFKSKAAAQKALNELPETGEFARGDFGLYERDGGFVLRRFSREGLGTGGIDQNWVDQDRARQAREEARQAFMRERGLVEDKFGNMVTPEEAVINNAGPDEDFDAPSSAQEMTGEGDARLDAGIAKPAVEIAGRLKVSPDRIAKPKHRELLSDAQDGDIVTKDDVRAQFDAGEGVFGDGLHIPTEEQIADQINALKVARMGKANEQKAIPKYEKEVSDLIDEAIELAAIGRTLSRIGTRKDRQAPAGDSTAGRNHNTVAGEYSNSVAAKLREAAESAAFLEALKRRNPPAKPPRAAQRASEPREMTEEGRAKDGGPIMPGDTFRTLSGRVTTPHPKQKSERYASQWLIDNAVEEAESRGDDFNARIFRSASIQKGGGLTTADRESMLMYLFGEQPQVVPSILRPLSGQTQESPSAAPSRRSNNKIFTDEAAERARAVLRSKLNQLNAGIDPEVLQAGITLAGWHLERGARAFADYARAMIEDMGEGVRPYLKSWYLGAKFDPRTAGMEGLSTAAEVEAFDLDALDSDEGSMPAPAPEADTEIVVTPAGREIEVRYKVVEGDSLIPSNLDDGRVNPDYPQELQPRNRSKAASELQITNIAANMNPRLLGESASTTDGAPIVSAEGVVESGNGRTMAILRAYRRGLDTAQAYRDWLAAQGYDVAGMRAPVLVRERITPMSQQELIEYTRESNERTTMQMSPEEQARSDADHLPRIIDLYVPGDIGSAANRPFVRAFINEIVPQSEQGDMAIDGGGLSIRGRKRIEAALMHAAYGDERLVADLFVDPSAEIKTIGGAMLDAAAPWLKMRQNADASLDVTPQIVEAVNIVRRAREEGKSIYDVANQIDAFTGATDPVTMDFLAMFFRGDRFTRQRSREAIADMLFGYADSAERIPPGPDMFGMAPPSPQEILRAIYEKRQREEATGQQSDLFAAGTPSDDGSAAGGGGAGQRPGAQAQDASTQESGGPVNVPGTSESVERDSGDGGTAQSVVQDSDGNAGSADAERAGRTGEGADKAGRTGRGDQRVSTGRSATGRARGDQRVRKPDGEFRPESRPAGDSEPAGSGRDSSQGSAVERERQDAVEADAHAPGADDLAQRLAAQRKAKNTPTKWGNKASIDAALPLLLPEQREDVLKAENRLADHNGILFTNGTGTGKTATGLGVVKRFINDGKDNIIVVVPSDKIAADWVKFARMLGVNLKQLEDTKSNGDTGPVVTTYANFGQNETLAQRDWDLVIADESHYLSSNEAGDSTAALDQLRALTGHHKGFDHWVRQRFPKEWGAYRDAMKARSDANGNLDIGPDRYAMLEAAEVRAREKWAPIETREREKWENRWAKQEGLPKTVFLSATPFAYAKNTDYAEGYLFHYVEPAQLKNERGSYGYNQGGPRERFMMQHFGYRMRYNKLTAPEAGVNSELMEQQFNEWLKNQGALSGRRLEVPFDYDRKFILVDDAVGTKIDEALKFLFEAEDGRYRDIYEAVMKQFDYHRRMYLLESMKARAAVPIIREHMAAGRKVVVFHDFNKGGGFDPFREAIREIYDDETRTLAREVLSRPMFKIDFSGLASPIETMRAAFPDALFFNGTVSKGQRRQNADLFNDDDSGRNLIVVQSDAGREGVSLHDTTGKHQRVEINLGMPVKPVAAMQIEGRIYRTGQASDAIFRYLTTGTAWEASAFASKIAERASTAENLALGIEARGLKEAFIDAYMNAGEHPVGKQDGKGGKEYDRKLSAALTASPFERAKTFYYAQGKNTRRRDQREGIDYFATPEPVGFKMVEWAGIRPNDKVLEPSAGHGAIARFFPETADVTMVEPSYELSQRAGLANGNARIVNDTFESLHITNKYDAIVMNPPYGHGGKTAIEHLAKAGKHLRNGGRIVALLPRGGMADKRLNDFLESEDAANLYRVASVDLPSSTFERAGTSVNTRVIVLERQDNPDDAAGINDRWIDLSGAQSITELFDRLEHVGMPERAAPATPEPRQELVEHITARGKRLTGIVRTDLTQEEAKAIDPYTFRKKNAEGKTGWFIRSKHLGDGAKFSIAPPTQSEAFKRWFGDSKVVDAEGNPLVVYHGTAGDFSAFDPSRSRDIGMHFGTQEQASKFGNAIMPVYLSIQNPLRVEDRFSLPNGHGQFLEEIYYDVDMSSAEYDKLLGLAKAVQDKWIDDRDADNTDIEESRQFWKLASEILARSGFDGLVYRNRVEGDGDSYVAFRPEQVKSAIGNIGTYDPSNPDIRYSLAAGVDRNQQIPVASAPLFDVEPQSLFSAAREWYRDNLLGTSVPNASLGAPVHFSHRGQSKALSIGRRNPIRMSIVQALPDLVRNAVVVEEAADRKGRDFIDGYATLVAPVEIDGNTYAVSMKVRRAHGREIFYTLQGFNIEGASDGGVWQLTPTGDSHSTAALQGDGDAAAVSMPGAAEAPSSDANVADSRASAPRNLQESPSTASQSVADSADARPVSRPGDSSARRQTLTVGELLDAINGGSRAFSMDASPAYEGILFGGEDNSNIIDATNLRNLLTSGRIGGVVAALVENGRVVLHDTASSVPVRNMPAGVQAVTAPDGTIHLVADALTPQSAQGVLLHEAFHQGVERLIGTPAWDRLLNRLGAIHRQASRQSQGRAREFYEAARRSVANAQRAGVPMTDELTAEEFGAYTIEHYDQAPAAFRKWVDDVIGEIKAWLLRRFGIQAGAVTPAQLRALAVAALRNDALAADAPRFSVAPPTSSPAFRRWFGDSKVVDENGEPLVVYHGTKHDFTEFQLGVADRRDAGWFGDGFYLTASRELASSYAMRERDYSLTERPANVMPVYVRMSNPYRINLAELSYDEGSNFTKKYGGNKGFQKWLSDNGYDGVIGYRDPEIAGQGAEFWEIVVFDPAQIKSATGNAGTFDASNPDIRYSLKPSKHFKDLTDKQKDFLDKIGPERLPQRFADRWRQLTDNLMLRIRQAGVDRYAALLRNDKAIYGEDTLEGSIASSAWVLARMSHSAGGALSAMIDHGRIYLDPKEKVIDVREGTTGLRQMFQQLGSPLEIDRFMAWVAANRARKLMDEGRENLFTEEEIDAGINLSTGRMEDGRNRGLTYAKVWREFQQFRDDVLRIAEQSGTISTEQRELWSEEFYVPFYRVLDDDSIGGPSMSSGLSRQQAYKRLKGGKQNLNDLLENTLLNFHHLLQSALKNQAARQALENAQALGIAHPTTESKRDKKLSTFVMEDGQKQWYNIADPLTFKALSALNSTGLNTPLMKAGRAFKRLFTNMTTITPQFMIANTLRDSLSAMATSPTSSVPFKNAVKGGLVYGNAQNRARMLASGASFSFGHVYGQSADEIKASLRGTLRNARIVSNPSLVPGLLMNAWRTWNKATDFAENVNRAGIWERNQARGKLKAAFEARDLMDFSAHGDALTVRILIDLVPFLNARIQGLDKLYRTGFKPGAKVLFGKGTKADKMAFARFAAVTGALSVLSMMLYLQNMDDEEYRKLEDWQRDTYWFIRIGENAFFIPKPFEVGAIATLAERALEQFMDPTVAGKKFADRLGHMLTDTFALDLPQIIKPAYELATNRNTFTDRPIEDMGMQRLSPSLRVKPGTSALAEGMSRGMEAIAGEAALSPLQIDHLIGAYLGQVGAGTVALADVIWRRAMGEELPARRWSEYQPIRRFYRDLGAPSPYTRYSTDFYEALREADKAYANVQHLLKYQEFKRADRLIEKEADKLDMRRWLNKVQRNLSKINAEMRQVQMDKGMSGEEKRQRLDRLRELRNMITEDVGKELEQERVRRARQ